MINSRRETCRTFLIGTLTAATLVALATCVFPQEPQRTENGSSAAAVVKTQGSGGQDAQGGRSPNSEGAQEDQEPLYREYRGVSLGLGQKEVREKFGKPKEAGDVMDFFVFSDDERARVYYDGDKKARALIVTYLGKNSGAPSPVSVLGSEIEKKDNGSLYKMVAYPKAGYWVAYSRTTGDSPLTMITMQKM